MIIGVGGRIGHGKDVVASWLAREHGFQVIRFSDALKEEVLTSFPRMLRALWGLTISDAAPAGDDDLRRLVWEIKPSGVRELLQEYGMMRRAAEPDYWVRRWLNRLPPRGHVVASDMRFPNEVAAIKMLGGRLWRVVRPDLGLSGDHESETALDNFQDWDSVLVNKGSIHDLEELARAAFVECCHGKEGADRAAHRP